MLDTYITNKTDASSAMKVSSRYEAEITAIIFLQRKQQAAAINRQGTAKCFSR